MFDNLTKTASIIPVLAAIYFTCRGFIGLGMTAELVTILTITLASLSWLLSQSILRFLVVKNKPFMATTVVMLGLAFLATEASFAHIGLEWMLAEGGLHIPAWAVWFFSIALSLTNVFCKWAFLGSAEPVEKSKITSTPRLVHPDPQDERALAEIAKAVNA